MSQLRPVSKIEKLFPNYGYNCCCLLLPDAGPLIGMLMLGNLFRESEWLDRLSDTAQNALMNIVTIALGTTVGATANAETFLSAQTLGIIVNGSYRLLCVGTGGVIMGNIFYKLSGGKLNPLIGSAGFLQFQWQLVLHKLSVKRNRKLPINACYGT